MKQSKRQKQPKQLKRPKRLKQNRNHTLHYNQEYSPKENVTLPVLTQDGPVITSYLDRAFKVFDKALDAHSKVLVVRFDLKVPAQISLPENAGLKLTFTVKVAHTNAQCATSSPVKLEIRIKGFTITSCFYSMVMPFATLAP